MEAERSVFERCVPETRTRSAHTRSAELSTCFNASAPLKTALCGGAVKSNHPIPCEECTVLVTLGEDGGTSLPHQNQDHSRGNRQSQSRLERSMDTGPVPSQSHLTTCDLPHKQTCRFYTHAQGML
ncbi:hypothetical protein AAFF_G00062890 [Aldrovandia affinis]|uniref:Uncharacterized protein n=1 Tax=Aldrovandia affinis TaxID=143900 RepID=A0AAD7RZS2_9TELE|nr:hypothetical protein AAFF_G00062890 [Aldrovandia affinis]